MTEIPAASIIKVIAIVAGFVFVYLLRDVLMVVFFAIIISSAVAPFADWLESKKIPRILSVLVLYLIVAALGILLLTILIPVTAYELRQLIQILPKLFSDASIALENIDRKSTR